MTRQRNDRVSMMIGVAPSSLKPLPRAARYRWIRQGTVSQSVVRRYLFGLLEIVTHPGPRYPHSLVTFINGVGAWGEFKARAPFFMAR